MSKWVEVRDAVKKEIEISGVAEEVRKSILELLAAEVTPAVETFLQKFVAGVKAEAETESGWSRIRDAVVIPYAISAVVWVSKYVIERTLIETEKVQ